MYPERYTVFSFLHFTTLTPSDRQTLAPLKGKIKEYFGISLTFVDGMVAEVQRWNLVHFLKIVNLMFWWQASVVGSYGLYQ